jgi:protease I
MSSTLRDRRVAVLAADGFEKVELTIPVAALRLAGATVDIVSLRSGRIRGVNLHEPASRVRVTKTLAEADPADYDALLVPGGFINPDLLRQSAAARDFVRAFDAAGKPMATLCHGPWVFASAGLLKGRTLTSWPGIRDDLVNAGATWLDEPFVRDGQLVTSRGPQDMVPFVRGIVAHFAGRNARDTDASIAQSSAPQRDEPPAAVVRAMTWMPRPSLRTAVGIALVAAGMVAASRRAGDRAA